MVLYTLSPTSIVQHIGNMSSLSSTSRESLDERQPNITTGVEDGVPYEFVTEDAVVDATAEYLQETVTGQRIETTITRTGEKEEVKIVTFTIHDKENPKNWSKAYKWYW